VAVNKEEVSTTCFPCGMCCSKYQIHLTTIETRRIADEMDLSWEDWLSRYTSQSWPGSDNFLLRRHKGACVFLEQAQGTNIARCLIQSFKPYACREWNSSLYQRACQEGLAKYWGLSVSPLGQPEGPDQDHRRFLSFLDEITLPEDSTPKEKDRP
jgi:Fe-S-cluster containining protein